MEAHGSACDLRFWVAGVLAGSSALNEAQRDKLFRACARSCLSQGTMDLYAEVFERAAGDIDAFFDLLNDVDGLQANALKTGHAWELVFESCSCPLHTLGCTDDARLCACSRQSVLFALHELWSDERFSAELLGTVLTGAPHCTLRIERHA